MLVGILSHTKIEKSLTLDTYLYNIYAIEKINNVLTFGVKSMKKDFNDMDKKPNANGLGDEIVSKKEYVPEVPDYMKTKESFVLFMDKEGYQDNPWAKDCLEMYDSLTPNELEVMGIAINIEFDYKETNPDRLTRDMRRWEIRESYQRRIQSVPGDGLTPDYIRSKKTLIEHINNEDAYRNNPWAKDAIELYDELNFQEICIMDDAMYENHHETDETAIDRNARNLYRWEENQRRNKNKEKDLKLDLKRKEDHENFIAGQKRFKNRLFILGYLMQAIAIGLMLYGAIGIFIDIFNWLIE